MAREGWVNAGWWVSGMRRYFRTRALDWIWLRAANSVVTGDC